MVSIVASACFCVMPRFDDQDVDQVAFQHRRDAPSTDGPPLTGGGGCRLWFRTLAESATPCKLAEEQGAAMPQDFGEAARDGRCASSTQLTFLSREAGVGVCRGEEDVHLRQVRGGQVGAWPTRRDQVVAPERGDGIGQRELGRIARRTPSGVLALVDQLGGAERLEHRLEHLLGQLERPATWSARLGAYSFSSQFRVRCCTTRTPASSVPPGVVEERRPDRAPPRGLQRIGQPGTERAPGASSRRARGGRGAARPASRRARRSGRSAAAKLE